MPPLEKYQSGQMSPQTNAGPWLKYGSGSAENAAPRTSKIAAAQFDYYMSPEGMMEGAAMPGTFSRMAIGMTPGAGVAGAFGYHPSYKTPTSPLPSGIERGPNLAEKIQKEDKGLGDYVDIGLTTVGMLPDAGWTAAALKAPVKDAATLSMNAIGPPAKKAAQATSRAITSVAQPIIDRIDVEGAIGRALAKRMMQQNPGMTFEQALAKTLADLAARGDVGVLADTGENMQRLTRNLTQGPGETAQRAKDVLGGRQASEKTRMISTLRENISPRLYYDVERETNRAMKQAAPFFKSAFRSNRSVSSPIIDKILLTPAGRDAMAFARQRVQNRMAKMAVPDKELTEQLGELVARGEAAPMPGGVASGLKLETLDLIRQDLYDQMQLMKKKVAKGDARKGEYNEIKDLYSEFRQALIDADVTGRAGPNSRKAGGGDYEKGLGAYAEGAKLQEALESGRAFIRGDPELLDEKFSALSPRQKDAYRAGVVQELVEMIGRDTSDSTPAQLMSALKAESSIRKKLQTITSTPGQFNNIMKDIENNLRFRETNRGARSVSQTGSIAMEEGQIAGDSLRAAGGIAREVAQGNPLGAASRAVQWGMSQLQKIQMPQGTRDELGRLLLSQNPADKQRALDLINKARANGWVYAP